MAAVFGCVVLSPAAAQPLDPASQSALDKTLQILLDPQARSGELAKSSQGTAVDQQVRALTGSDALTQEVYQIAGEVLKDLAQSTGGDPAEDAPRRGSRSHRPGGVRGDAQPGDLAASA